MSTLILSACFKHVSWPARFTVLRPALAAFLASILALAAAAGVSAQEEGAEGQLYIPLSEPLVVNYGGPGRLKYLKAEISLRVEDTADAAVIRHHMPLIRHKMVMLFSRQAEETVNTQAGREQLRQTALNETNEALALEEGRETIVSDLLFRNFVVQR